MAHIDVKPSDDGKAVILNITDQQPTRRIVFRLNPTDVGQFATILLRAANECAQRTGALAKLRATKTNRKKLAFTHAHEVVIADAMQSSETTVLMFALGATELCIGIPKSGLAALGRSLLTVSAAPTAPQ